MKFGTIKWSDGSEYHGEFVKNKVDGNGTLTLKFEVI